MQGFFLRWKKRRWEGWPLSLKIEIIVIRSNKLKTLNIQNYFQMAQSRHLRMYASILLGLFVFLEVEHQNALKKTEFPWEVYGWSCHFINSTTWEYKHEFCVQIIPGRLNYLGEHISTIPTIADIKELCLQPWYGIAAARREVQCVEGPVEHVSFFSYFAIGVGGKSKGRILHVKSILST